MEITITLETEEKSEPFYGSLDKYLYGFPNNLHPIHHTGEFEYFSNPYFVLFSDSSEFLLPELDKVYRKAAIRFFLILKQYLCGLF